MFSDTALLKMEAFWTNRRKPGKHLSFDRWLALWNPSRLLKPAEKYYPKLYLSVAVLTTLHALLWVILANALGLALGILIFPEFLPVIRDPKNHKLLISILSREGFYLLPFYPLGMLLVSLLLEWPRFFFWNRRAKRLLDEGALQVSLNDMREAPAEDNTIWPPPPDLQRHL
ncbi:MAG: hypothetical protein ACRYFS_02130 [Janthinobacterium lividum]